MFPTSVLSELGRTLRAARERQARSLEAVARPAQISAAYLHKLERGVVDSPSPRVLARVATVLDTPYLRVMELAGYLDEPQLAEARLRKGTAPHPLADRDLTPAEWRAVVAFITALVAQRDQTARDGQCPRAVRLDDNGAPRPTA